MKVKNLLAIGLVIILAIVSYIWFFVYNKEHKDYAKADSHYVGHADSLHQMASENQDKFQQEFINKAVEIEGVVKEVGLTRFTLGSGMICTLDSAYIEYMPKVGDTVMVKGRVVGTDEDILTADILCNLDQCIFINHQ
jgi:hypothetical protein